MTKEENIYWDLCWRIHCKEGDECARACQEYFKRYFGWLIK